MIDKIKIDKQLLVFHAITKLFGIILFYNYCHQMLFKKCSNKNEKIIKNNKFWCFSVVIEQSVTL